MHSETELERLAAARPAIRDGTHEVVSPAAQARFLSEILAVPAGRRSSHRAARERPRPLSGRGNRAGWWTGVAAASAAGALLTGAALGWNNGHQAPAAKRSHGRPAVTPAPSTALTQSIRALHKVGHPLPFSHPPRPPNPPTHTPAPWVP